MFIGAGAVMFKEAGQATAEIAYQSCHRVFAAAAAAAAGDSRRVLCVSCVFVRTWLLLLRALIQLPMMTSVLACVSSMGGTGYLCVQRQGEHRPPQGSRGCRVKRPVQSCSDIPIPA